MAKKYTREFLISEINRFIKYNNKFPLALDMKMKNGYPPISAYREMFGSWDNAINAMLDAEIENIPCDNNLICYPYQLNKYTTLCTQDMESLWTQFPKLSMEIIATIYNSGYSRGCDSMIENVCISTLYDLYL